jgi:glycosyltransferase involved in cell wall biosynthesis
MRQTAPVPPKQWGLPDDAEAILFAGRLSPEKNLFVLLDALELVLERFPKAAAVLFGEGPLHSRMAERIARSRFADRYHLRGYTQDLWRWMRSAKVVVLISRFEGNPNVVLEAMAIGCPVVASDIPQHREILDDSMAVFCAEGSVPGTAAAIGETLSDGERARARAERAQSRAQTWSIEESALQYLSLYETLVAQERK